MADVNSQAAEHSTILTRAGKQNVFPRKILGCGEASVQQAVSPGLHRKQVQPHIKTQVTIIDIPTLPVGFHIHTEDAGFHSIREHSSLWLDSHPLHPQHYALTSRENAMHILYTHMYIHMCVSTTACTLCYHEHLSREVPGRLWLRCAAAAAPRPRRGQLPSPSAPRPEASFENIVTIST